MKMKKLTWLIILLELWHNGFSQAQGGAEQYYNMSERQSNTIVPVVYYQTSKNWYMEGRYNYEALNTMSVYAGKTFEKKSVVSYAASPIVGAVIGKFNGGSVGLNSEADYKKYSFSSQLQYTFSMQSKTENFIYSWSDFSYQPLSNFFTGFSLQQTNIYKEQCKWEKGVFVKALFNKWTIPVYVFSPQSKERFFVLGLSCSW